jgi:hypothetical protein
MGDFPGASSYDAMKAYQEHDLAETRQRVYDASRLGGTAADSGPDYERIDNPLNVYLFDDKAVVICEDGRVVEYSRS